MCGICEKVLSDARALFALAAFVVIGALVASGHVRDAHDVLTSGADWFMLKGRGYQFWSGIGSGSPVVVGVYVFWRRHVCYVRGCPRLVWKSYGEHNLCRRHHPEDPPTAEELRTDA